MVLASVAKLGFVADLLSRPTMLGYMNGLALTILVGQLPKLLGFSVDSDNFIGDVVGFIEGVANGEVVVAAALIGCGALLLIVILDRVLPKIPAVLIAVIAAIVATTVFDLGGRGVELVGTLPQGLPSLTLAGVSSSRTCHCSSLVQPASRWLHSPTPSQRRQLSRLARAPKLTVIRRWSALGRPTWQPACFKASRSALAAHAQPSPSRRAPRRRLPGWSAPS